MFRMIWKEKSESKEKKLKTQVKQSKSTRVIIDIQVSLIYYKDASQERQKSIWNFLIWSKAFVTKILFCIEKSCRKFFLFSNCEDSIRKAVRL